jgi:hypothetical protein
MLRKETARTSKNATIPATGGNKPVPSRDAIRFLTFITMLLTLMGPSPSLAFPALLVSTCPGE